MTTRVCHGPLSSSMGAFTTGTRRLSSSMATSRCQRQHAISSRMRNNRHSQKYDGHLVWQLPSTVVLQSKTVGEDIDFETEQDPFKLLGLRPTASTIDKKEIKRAYKRMALRYHPDVTVNKDASPQEKKVAGDRFAKINWAYQTLLGKERASGVGSTSTSSKSGTRTTTTTSSGGWTPPHRRSGSYTTSSSSSSKTSTTGPFDNDWRDYIPNYGKEYSSSDDDYDYDDADGDSFAAIFSDFLTEAAAAAAGRGGAKGLLNDFVEFLEQSVDGYAEAGSNDQELVSLLATGTAEEVSNELDDTELVVEQLARKLRDTKDELLQVQADAASSTRYVKTIELEERAAELKSRQSVVEGYLQKSRKRLLKLQTRYKELVGSRSRGRADGESDYSSPRSGRRETVDSFSTSERSSSSSKDTKSGGDSWQNEGFGSFGRGRGSSRRRTRPRPETETRSSARPSDNNSSGSSRSSPQTGYRQRPTPVSTPSSSRDSTLPPHRRTSSVSQEESDKRRLRELKVDEEFDKLKRDLGL